MIDALIIEQFERLADLAPAVTSHNVPIGPWEAALEQSGFLDLLINEKLGGAGVERTALPFIAAVEGARLLPGPIAETMVARSLISPHAAPQGMTAIAPARSRPDGRLQALRHIGAGAAHVLLSDGRQGWLMAMASADDDASWTDSSAIAAVDIPSQGLAPLAVAIDAACMAGAMDTVLRMTVSHVGLRQQFGQPIGHFQAVQQQLATMAEQAAMVNAAVFAGFATGDDLDMARAAAIKLVACEGAATLSASAHALFGALGMSLEHPLPHYTRALRQWGVRDGGEQAMALCVADSLLATPASFFDFSRALFAAPAAGDDR